MRTRAFVSLVGVGALGQVFSAQSHLANNDVGVGNVFLFWGLYRPVVRKGRGPSLVMRGTGCLAGYRSMRETRTLRSMRRGLET